MEVLVEDLHEVVDGLEVVEVVIVDVDTYTEVEASVPTINDLEVAEFHKIGVFGIADSYNCMNFFYQFLLFFIIKVHVPFGQPRFTRPILYHYEPNHVEADDFPNRPSPFLP